MPDAHVNRVRAHTAIARSRSEIQFTALFHSLEFRTERPFAETRIADSHALPGFQSRQDIAIYKDWSPLGDRQLSAHAFYLLLSTPLNPCIVRCASMKLGTSFVAWAFFGAIFAAGQEVFEIDTPYVMLS